MALRRCFDVEPVAGEGIDLESIITEIKKTSDFNAVSAREIILHFQALVSAGSYRFAMNAPGLYYPPLKLYVISKSGMVRGHTSMNKTIQPMLPAGKNICYGFVLYPESFVRTCLDRVLRRTTKNITNDLRLSMENVFNNKHYDHSLVDSEIEKQLIELMKNDLGVTKRRTIVFPG